MTWDKLQWPTSAESSVNSHIKLQGKSIKTETSKYWNQLNSREEHEYDSWWNVKKKLKKKN